MLTFEKLVLGRLELLLVEPTELIVRSESLPERFPALQGVPQKTLRAVDFSVEFARRGDAGGREGARREERAVVLVLRPFFALAVRALRRR